MQQTRWRTSRRRRCASDFGLDESEALPDTSVFSHQGHHHAGPLLDAARHVRRPQPGAPAEHRPAWRRCRPTASRYDVRRFRPNVLVDVDRAGRGVPRVGLGGRRLSTSARPRCDVTIPTIRCVVPTRPQPGLDLDRGITRQLVDRTDRFLGVYADVARRACCGVGDEVRGRGCRLRAECRRAGAVGGEQGGDPQVQRLLEATVLRGEAASATVAASSSSRTARNSLARNGVKAGLGRVPGTSRVTSVDLIGRQTSSGSQRRRSELPQMRNRLMHQAERLGPVAADRPQRDDLRGARRKVVAAQRDRVAIQLDQAVVVASAAAGSRLGAPQLVALRRQAAAVGQVPRQPCRLHVSVVPSTTPNFDRSALRCGQRR